jgi:antitoxin ParD1/3/4
MDQLVVQVSSDMKDFVESRAASAGLESGAAFVRRLILAEQHREAKAALKEIVAESIASGEPTELTAEDFARMRAVIRQEFGKGASDGSQDHSTAAGGTGHNG